MQDQLKEILQQQLRDVHSPEAVSWWPLAIGWWLVIVLSVIVISIGVISLLRHIKRNRYRKRAIAELNTHFQAWQQDQNAPAYLQNANSLLKRSVLHLSASAGAAQQSGAAWLETLNQHVKQPLSHDTQQALAILCYQAEPQVNTQAVHQEVVAWLRSHKVPTHAPRKPITDKVTEAKHA